ncbi:MAG: XRE family transcriptional regulator [Balneolaceae bacterium]|nr:MAG: XRE family transcriptional regulator [Balneolaceae bacterium]
MGFTQADVAEQLNTITSEISRMENHAKDIKISTLTKYAKAFGKKGKLEIE